MKPLVTALNILQSETNTHLGWLLPVVFQLEAKLSRLETTSKMCLPLIRAVQDGIEKRFGGMIKDPELIAAAILLPKFKTTWTERADIIEAAAGNAFSQAALLHLQMQSKHDAATNFIDAGNAFKKSDPQVPLKVRTAQVLTFPISAWKQLFNFSEKAYSTVAYLLREADDGTKTTCLVTSKSRVAPLKKMSLRRLEFMGAVIGVKLGNNQPKPLNMELRQVGVFGQIQ
ncbi:zinc finger BED domain-containing 1-like protein [Labeo rohita]|uniref:Zinc finger BED domain-containing 1-like protein n=1 Tax=Labeo rohita TaxID=84645 RepID=A0A498P194_LABRO|nr:zinc finger BED domain-containing 1-like protein [Labeo rohita]